MTTLKLEPIRVPIATAGITVTFCATCAFCGTKTDGTVDASQLSVPFFESVTLKPGWGVLQTDNGSRIWCGKCDLHEWSEDLKKYA